MTDLSKKPSNRLERFVRDNREVFDMHEPSDDLWSKIVTQLPTTSNEMPQQEDILHTRVVQFRPPWQRYWRYAAAVLVFVGLGWGYWRVQTMDETGSIVRTVAPQYSKQMVHYTDLIETKREEIKQMANEEPDLYKNFAQELIRLEYDYKSLQAELPQTPNQEELIRAMMQNLQVQLDVLNQQLSIIQKLNEAKQNHGKSMQSI